MKIAIYARVSTNNGSQDVDNQLEELRGWSQRLGGNVVKEYVDHASGSKSDRTALKELLDDAHKRRFDTLIIWALDRLSREGISRLSGYLEQLKKYGVRVLSHQEPWLDTSGPVADLLVAVFGWVAKQERERISERIKMGLKRAQKRKKLGRPTVRYNQEDIIRLNASGASTRTIAKELGISNATVSRVLQNPRKNEPITY